MTQFDNPYADTESKSPKTSGMAVTSLVCSLIFCCPVTTVIGILLGLVAMVGIGSNPMKKGKGLAAAAIVIGILATGLQVLGGYVGWKTFVIPVIEGPTNVLVAGYAGDTATFKDGFYGSGAMVDDAEVSAFIGELQQRYGGFVACELHPQQNQQSTYGQPAAPFQYVLQFDNATVDSEAEIIFSDPTQGGIVMKLGYLIIFDPDLGDLKYPAD